MIKVFQLPIFFKDAGSIYTRWGKTACEGNGTEKVYSGKTYIKRTKYLCD
jgi:hypothetical protein